MKKLAQNSILFLVYSNIWVALCLAVLVLGVAKHYAITDCYLFATFAFLGTFATYNFHRLVRNIQFEKIRLVTDRIRWQNNYRIVLLSFSLLCAIAAGIIFFYLPVKPLSIILLAFSGIIIFFYAIPLPGSFVMLRSIPFIKNLLILMVWIVLICIPLINRDKEINFIEITAIALFTFAQIIPFDIRDLPYDSRDMKTIPQILGKTNAQLLTTFLILSSAALLLTVNGFHWSILLPLSFSLFGCWKNANPANDTYLEIVWDGSLLLLGLYFFTVGESRGPDHRDSFHDRHASGRTRDPSESRWPASGVSK